MLILPNCDNATEIQKFLSTHSGIISGNNDLSEKFNIDVTTEMLDTVENDETSELIFVYNNGKNKGGLKSIEEEANKLLLNYSGKIISRTFKKIHDVREAANTKRIEWGTAEMEPHLDGTHISIFKYNKTFFIRAWHKNPDMNKSIEMCVRDILASKHHMWFDPFNINDIAKSCCWTFEFVSPQFKNIVEYKEPKLYLLSMFNRDHSFECSRAFVDEFATRNCFNRLERKKIGSISEAVGITNAMTTLDKGLIITDSDKCRIKVINPLYKIIADLINSNNKPAVSDLAKLVLLGHQSAVKSICDEYSIVIKLLELATESLLSNATTVWNIATIAESRKEFAKIVSTHSYPASSLLFEWYTRKSICKDKGTLLKLIKPKHIVNVAKSENLYKFTSALSDAEIDREYKVKNIA